MDLTTSQRIKLPKEFQNLPSCYHKGRELYNNFPWLRDIATFMEHPESFHFYKTYLCNPNRFKKMIVYLRIYELISKHFGEHLNGYHKIFILYRLVNHSVYGPLLKRHLSFEHMNSTSIQNETNTLQISE